MVDPGDSHVVAGVGPADRAFKTRQPSDDEGKPSTGHRYRASRCAGQQLCGHLVVADVAQDHSGAPCDVARRGPRRDRTKGSSQSTRRLTAAQDLVHTLMASGSIGIALTELDGRVRVVHRSPARRPMVRTL